jgi:predicted NUDIX family NTP pyrophosphohydrolase
MARRSAGLLVFRRVSGAGEPEVELLLAHPGGPFFSRRDLGVWTIPKGEYDDSEPPESAAEREFTEEIGVVPPTGPRLDLGEVRQASGKLVRAFAVEGDVDLTDSMSNLFEMEWPPASGTIGRFPEIDRAEWFSVEEARRRLNPSQTAFVDRLLSLLG